MVTWSLSLSLVVASKEWVGIIVGARKVAEESTTREMLSSFNVGGEPLCHLSAKWVFYYNKSTPKNSLKLIYHHGNLIFYLKTFSYFFFSPSSLPLVQTLIATSFSGWFIISARLFPGGLYVFFFKKYPIPIVLWHFQRAIHESYIKKIPVLQFNSFFRTSTFFYSSSENHPKDDHPMEFITARKAIFSAITLIIAQVIGPFYSHRFWSLGEKARENFVIKLHLLVVSHMEQLSCVLFFHLSFLFCNFRKWK